MEIDIFVYAQNVSFCPVSRLPVLRLHQFDQFVSVLEVNSLGTLGELLPLFPGLLGPLLLCRRCSLDSLIDVLAGGGGHFPEWLLGGRVDTAKRLRRLDRLAIDYVEEGGEIDLSTGFGSLGTRTRA